MRGCPGKNATLGHVFIRDKVSTSIVNTAGKDGLVEGHCSQQCPTLYAVSSVVYHNDYPGI